MAVGEDYVLRIDDQWTSADGQKLAKPYEKKFAVIEVPGDPALSPLRRHVAESRAWLDWSCPDGSPLLDECFAWLDENWPDESPPVVSWGVLLQDCMQVESVVSYTWLLLPVFFIILTVMCFNFVGDGLRDAADPYH